MTFILKKAKILFVLGVSALLAVGTIVPSATAEESVVHEFTDVAPHYQQAVSYVVENEIANGLTATQFGISKEIIRGDAAIMIARAVGLINDEKEAAASGFSDIPARGVSAINALKEAGIVNGKTDNTFGFYSNITRGEASIMLARAYALSTHTTKVPFTDVIGTRYESSVNALVANKVTNGINSTQYGTFKNIKRGDFAIFLERLAEEPILDTESPVLQYEGETAINLEVNDVFSVPLVTAIDNVDKFVGVGLDITDASGNKILLEEFTTAISGTYSFNYSAIDQAGNSATKLTITVTVSELGLEPEPKPIEEVRFLELDKPYVSSDNKMTVTMEKLEVVENQDFYEINFTYREKNNTTDQIIDQGTFKIYYKDGASEPQYGFFNKLYPGEESSRSYTFKALNSQEVIAIEYGADVFFKKEPTAETLKWTVEPLIK